MIRDTGGDRERSVEADERRQRGLLAKEERIGLSSPVRACGRAGGLARAKDE